MTNTIYTNPDLEIRITGSGSKEEIAEQLRQLANDILGLSKEDILDGGEIENHVLLLEYDEHIFEDGEE